MKIYKSKEKEGVIIHLPESLDDLKEIALRHSEEDGDALDCVVLLNGGCFSRKGVRYFEGYDRPWAVTNHVDDSEQELTDAEMATDTNIMEAIKKNSFLALVGEEECKCELTH